MTSARAQRAREIGIAVLVGSLAAFDITKHSHAPGPWWIWTLLGGVGTAVLFDRFGASLRGQFARQERLEQTLDARGRVVQVIHAESLAMLAQDLPPQVRKGLRSAALPHLFNSRLGLPDWRAVAVAAALVFLLAVAYWGGATDRVAMTAISAFGMIFLSTGHNVMRKAMAGAYLRHARCPGCAYSLSDLPAEPDGCIVCPECGAAWRLAEDPARLG